MACFAYPGPEHTAWIHRQSRRRAGRLIHVSMPLTSGGQVRIALRRGINTCLEFEYLVGQKNNASQSFASKPRKLASSEQYYVPCYSYLSHAGRENAFSGEVWKFGFQLVKTSMKR